ncbi:MAG: type II toxin-antitoxin system prevent-host-death family antitoxin [Deltaproteobacteria bacterium]|nr:type II toxin-antitoxin system prevent-host-death family antitoxin [Deltaproteobacteria bacterium]
MVTKTIPLSEVRQKLKDILATLEATGEPYLITQHHRPKAVLVRYEDYTALVEQTAEGHPHVVRRSTVSGDEPVIRGTRISVRHIIERIQASHSVEDILAALPHLTAAQVYDALSYYYDHQAEMDQLIEESQPERVIATQGLKVEKVADGIAVAHDQRERW